MSKVALIYGVTGQCGSYLSEILLNRGYHVHGVARRTATDNTSNLKEFLHDDRFHLVEGDITDAHSVNRTIIPLCPDEIYNLAAQSHVHTSFLQPQYTFDTIVKGTLNILEAARECFSHPKVYHAASSEMYGSCSDPKWIKKMDDKPNSFAIMDCLGHQNEQTKMVPNSPYAVAKLAAYNLCNLYRDSYGMFIVNGIQFNSESKRRGANFVTQKIANYVRQLNQDLPTSGANYIRTLPLFKLQYAKLKLGNLEASRDWSHARDIMYGAFLSLQHDKPDNYVFASGETHTIKEFLQEAFAWVNQSYSDYVEHDPSLLRPKEVPYLRGDASHARKTLNWEPEVTFNKLVHEMISHGNVTHREFPVLWVAPDEEWSDR